jgi:hypothetical protein
MIACQTFVRCNILPRGPALLNSHFFGFLAEEIKRMSSRPWINRYGTVAILVMLLFLMNPEVRSFLLLANFIGLDLLIFFFVIQLRILLPAITSYPYRTRSLLCVASYTALRVTTRAIGLLLAPARVSGSLTTLLFVLSKNMWCPRGSHLFSGTP